MSTAHTCFRSALTQAFRSPKSTALAPHTVCAFLVPALRPSRRPFSSGKRRSRPHPAGEYAESTARLLGEPFAAKSKPLGRIKLPDPADRGDIQQWLREIEPFLPEHLRQQPATQEAPPPVSAFDVAFVLSRAQEFSLDILSHLGLVEGRWQTVTWIAKKLIDNGRHAKDTRGLEEVVRSGIWLDIGSHNLYDVCEGPIRIPEVLPPRLPAPTLHELSSDPDTITFKRRTIKQGTGQLWRSLGNMILVASERQDSEHSKIMPHVLEIIAHLHHTGFIHESVYTYKPHESKYAFHQPPTLHMLSSKILTALSDATWNAHEASVKNAKARSSASYFLGYEIPGSRYKIEVTEVATELWLELVLWSCLHGGWILDGAAILEKLASSKGDRSWGLISWREIIEAEQQKATSPSSGWDFFPQKADLNASAEDRARTRKTISSEVVTGIVDGLVNEMRLGVGARGTRPEALVDHMTSLKKFLEESNLSLGSATWDSVVARLLESPGLAPEKSPALMLRISQLATEFGTEISTANSAADTNTEVPYFFEPTTISLVLLHRAMRAYIHLGDIRGAFATLELLQQHTDNNKQRSLQQFFELLKTKEPTSEDSFTSRLPPVDFPSFDNHIPVPLLAKLLDLATETKQYELGRWLLLSKDLDGPLIGQSLYTHPNIEASIVRFGTLAGENDLVLKIINQVDRSNKESSISPYLFAALFASQIQLHRWASVLSMQQHITDEQTFVPRPRILATFAGELLRTSCRSEKERSDAQTAFSELLFDWEQPIMSNIQNELYCILAVMSTVGKEWSTYCSQFLAFSRRQTIKLTPTCFNLLLDGALEAYGSLRGVKLVEQWCRTSTATFKAYRSPGGVPAMSRFRPDKGKELGAEPQPIEIVQERGAKLVLRGRIRLNRQTILSILRTVEQEVEQWSRDGCYTTEKRAQARETMQWAAHLLKSLGQTSEDITRDLGRLAELAEFEAL